MRAGPGARRGSAPPPPPPAPPWPHGSSSRCRSCPSLPARTPPGRGEETGFPGRRVPAGAARERRAGAAVPARGAAQVPPAETGASAGGGEVKERGLSLDNAGPGPFWCNRIITEGRASLSKHTRPPARPLPGINIKGRGIVFCKRAIPFPSAPSPCPRSRSRLSPGSARRSAGRSARPVPPFLRTQGFLPAA